MFFAILRNRLMAGFDRSGDGLDDERSSDLGLQLLRFAHAQRIVEK